MPDFATLSDLFDGFADIVGGLSYFVTSLGGGPSGIAAALGSAAEAAGAA